jgi:hypothetical protein
VSWQKFVGLTGSSKRIEGQIQAVQDKTEKVKSEVCTVIIMSNMARVPDYVYRLFRYSRWHSSHKEQ